MSHARTAALYAAASRAIPSHAIPSRAAASRAAVLLAPVLVAAMLALLPARAWPQATEVPLVADLSSGSIAITAGFAGTDVLLFGATDGPGDVIVVVSGPRNTQIVRRKERVLGIWVNRDAAVFTDVPSYYTVAATRRLADILSPELRADHEIGLDKLRLVTKDSLPEAEARAFRDGLIRNFQRSGRYSKAPGIVTMRGTRLFRTTLSLPTNVSPGRHEISVFLIRDGEIVGGTLTPLTVKRAGFEASIFQFAHQRSMLFGVVAVLVALVSGWFAGFVFRKF